jgi:hypothetical protein
MPNLASQYNAESTLSSTSGTATAGHAWGFDARSVRVINDKSVPVYVRLNSTVGSTDGHRTCAGETLQVDNVLTAGLGLASTTTSTATQVRVAAWGS